MTVTLFDIPIDTDIPLNTDDQFFCQVSHCDEEWAVEQEVVDGNVIHHLVRLCHDHANLMDKLEDVDNDLLEEYRDEISQAQIAELERIANGNQDAHPGNASASGGTDTPDAVQNQGTDE